MSTFDGQIVDADGLPWWSPSQVYYSHQLVCVYLFCLVFIIAAHLDNRVMFYQLSPLTTCHSKFFQCHSDHFKSLCAGDCIDSRK